MNSYFYSFLIVFIITAPFSFAGTGEKIQGAQHLVSGAIAVGAATGKINMLGAVATITGTKAEEAAEAAPNPWAKALFTTIAISEFYSAYESFSNASEMTGIGRTVSSNGNVLNCPNGNCAVGQESSSAGGDIFASDEAFQNYVSENQLDQVFGEIKNPLSEINKLADQGYKRNSDGSVTTPEGQTVNSSDVSSAASNGGSIAAQVAEMKARGEKLLKKEKKYLNLVQSFRAKAKGGFANKVNATSGSSKQKSRSGFRLSFGASQRKPASAFGPVEFVKGDPVSAAGDNVFHIIERAYEEILVKKILKQPK